MGKHALGKAGGAGGILHVGHVVLFDGLGQSHYLALGGVLGLVHGLLPGVAAGHLKAAGDDVAKLGQAAGMEMALFAGGKLRAQLLHDGRVVAVLEALDHHQGVGVALAQEVLRLVDLVGGVDRDQHAADPDAGPEGQIPLGHVGGPDGDVVALFDAHGQKGPGEFVYLVLELRIGAGVVQGSVAEGVLGGKFTGGPLQHLAEGAVDEGVLFPQVLARAPLVGGQAIGVDVVGHVVGEVGEHDAGVGEVRGPALDPLQRHIAVVVDGIQRLQGLLDGHVALAHHAVFDLAVLHDGVLDVEVFDALAQVFDRGLRAFAEEAEGVVYVP